MEVSVLLEGRVELLSFNVHDCVFLRSCRLSAFIFRSEVEGGPVAVSVLVVGHKDDFFGNERQGDWVLPVIVFRKFGNTVRINGEHGLSVVSLAVNECNKK